MKNTNEEEAFENRFVVDVNIIFSGVLSRKEIYKKLFSEYTFFTPEYALIELNKYREVILNKTKGIDEEDLRRFTVFIFSKMVVVPDYVISEESYHKAEKMLESLDKNDLAYAALAEEFGLVLLTRDKKLYEGLKSQGYEKIRLFSDFVEEISA